MTSWTQTIERYLAEGRAVSGGKGEGTAKAQLALQNQMQQKAFDAQMQQLADLKRNFDPYMSGQLGYDPVLKASLQSQFQNQVAGDYGQAGAGVRSAILARGGGGQSPMSGSDIQGIMGLESAKANTLSQGTLGLGISNLQQALANKFQAGNLESGNAATLSSPVASFGSGASNALNTYVQAANSGFGAQFMSALGSSLGRGLGGIATGGIGGGLQNTFGFMNPPGH